MAENNANKVRFGLSNVAIAPITATGFGDIVKIPGAVSLTADPEGDSSTFFADNGAYFTVVTNAGYTGELEMALIPDSVKQQIFGWEIDKNGALVEVADAAPAPFALLFQVNGDKRNRYNVYYNVTAGRPKNEDKTTEDKSDPSTEKLPVTMIPTNFGGKRVTKLSIEPSATNEEIIKSFYAEVYEPDFSGQS